MDKSIVTVFMIVAGVIAATLVFNAVYPAVMQSADALVGMKGRIDERMRSQVEVIHVAKSGGYSDVALVWVKNVGATSIRAVERCDVFFGPEGDFERIPYGVGDPHWDYQVENDSSWKPTATLRLSIDLDYVLTSGERYFVKVTTPNGIADETYFNPSW